MKKILFHHTVIILAATVFLFFSTSASAKIEWEFINDITITEMPKDIALTKDGGTAYILGAKNIHIFSLRENRLMDTIPLKKTFSEIALTPEGDRIFLTSTKNKKISVIEISEIYDLEIGDSVVLGNRNAKASVVAFLDYQ